MAKRTLYSLSLSAVLVLCSLPVLVSLAGPADKPIKNEYFKGRVVPMADLVEKEGGKLDADAAPYWMALVADDGKVYALLKDDGARMFFKDAKLLNRPMRLTGRLLPGGLLQVVAVHSYQKGELCDVYYWCDICSIKRYEKKMCDCCGGPMELREEPVKK